MRKTYFNPKVSIIFIICILNVVCVAQFPFIQKPVAEYKATDGFVAHEWGTFTTLSKSNGELLGGLELEEEHLPPFVYNICFCYNYENYKGFFSGYHDLIKNVTVKMETPVLYFYSVENAEKNITVDVKFKNGTISQWFPNRSAGESANTPLISLPLQLSSPPQQILDFSIPRTGWIQWKAFILPLTDQTSYADLPLVETSQWLAPRATKSNLIRIRNNIEYDSRRGHYYPVNGPDQVEKFLFYRGIGNFQPSLKVEFNTKQNLVITNSGNDPFDYVMVYEKRSDGKTVIWWSGHLDGQKKKVILKPTDNGSINVTHEMENFANNLVNAGLYMDEALAMLETWKKSYFEHEGLKVFWILPPKAIDEILPMQINPNPNSLKRVLVGRSEIISPEFEKQLSNLTLADLFSKYQEDRFLNAYQQLTGVGIPGEWTDYNVLDKETEIPVLSNNESIWSVFPNPTTRNLTVKIKATAMIKIFAANGELVYILENAKAGENMINIELLPKGIYSIKAEYGNGSFNSKKIIKD